MNIATVVVVNIGARKFKETFIIGVYAKNRSKRYNSRFPDSKGALV